VGTHSNLILPELASGRGTARRSRVVEGQAHSRASDDVSKDCVDILEDLPRGYPEGVDFSSGKPGVARCIPPRPISKGVGFPIDFDREPGIAAEEVENIGPAWMLSAELHSLRLMSQALPKNHLRQGHRLPKDPCVLNAVGSRFGCNIFEHPEGPSTMLRMVPLPETSSGRNGNLQC
jgi:hypothetical protein